MEMEEDDFVLRKIEMNDTQGQWQWFGLSCCLREGSNRYIGFESMASDRGIMAMDYIGWTTSTRTCDAEDEGKCVLLPPPPPPSIVTTTFPTTQTMTTMTDSSTSKEDAASGVLQNLPVTRPFHVQDTTTYSSLGRETSAETDADEGTEPATTMSHTNPGTETIPTSTQATPVKADPSFVETTTVAKSTADEIAQPVGSLHFTTQIHQTKDEEPKTTLSTTLHFTTQTHLAKGEEPKTTLSTPLLYASSTISGDEELQPTEMIHNKTELVTTDTLTESKKSSDSKSSTESPAITTDVLNTEVFSEHTTKITTDNISGPDTLAASTTAMKIETSRSLENPLMTSTEGSISPTTPFSLLSSKRTTATSERPNNLFWNTVPPRVILTQSKDDTLNHHQLIGYMVGGLVAAIILIMILGGLIALCARKRDSTEAPKYVSDLAKHMGDNIPDYNSSGCKPVTEWRDPDQSLLGYSHADTHSRYDSIGISVGEELLRHEQEIKVADARHRQIENSLSRDSPNSFEESPAAATDFLVRFNNHNETPPSILSNDKAYNDEENESIVSIESIGICHGATPFLFQTGSSLPGPSTRLSIPRPTLKFAKISKSYQNKRRSSLSIENPLYRP
ncbi:hypothetical protein PoB_006075800 [Plakobranchus ocellatus]|uniref:Uncharacterized protein n=1 Tax=Plakobranchus ocellatus TaxID=259542 RepID=A0AAV4CQT0_9GAST|nr:hypothetical protein PoB_006075800 [Plakobranchus ocellatus]